MRRIGIRELRQNASQYIRLVKAGETIEVTDRDVPVALLTPLPKGEKKSRIDEMIEQGLITEATRDLRDLRPLDFKPGEKPLSQLLQEMRDDERY